MELPYMRNDLRNFKNARIQVNYLLIGEKSNDSGL